MYFFAAPVPGGCNLTFKTEIAPYQLVKLLNDDIIRVDAQAPSIQGGPCELARPSLEFYHLYLKEPNYLEENYFDGLEKMMTVNAIRAYGNKVHLFLLFSPLMFVSSERFQVTRWPN